MVEVPRINMYECCGCCLCVLALPEVFRATPDGLAEVYAPEGAPKSEVQKIMDDCPIGCVHWYKK